VLVGLPQGVGNLVILFYLFCFYLLLFAFILLYSHNTHQVLIGLPQGADGLTILYYFILFHFRSFSYHTSGARKLSPRGWWPFI
jgi:hypothetical protein